MKQNTTYKQTELGLIPEDWEVKKLGEVIKLGNGKDYKHLNSGNIPVYGTGGIITYVDKYLFNGKSVGIGRKGSIDKPVLLDGKFWTVDTLFYVKEFFNSDIDFIYNSFLKIPWLKYNEATGLPSLSQNIINNLKIPLPPLPEQKKIADCLSTWDCAIEKQSQLINALTQRKKALMQQLLTGKKRLPGFSDEWKEVKLGEISIKKSSTLQANSLEENNGEFKVYGASGIVANIDFYNESEEYIGIVKDGSGVGNLMLCDAKSSVLGTLDIIKNNKKSNLFFIYLILSKIHFEKYKVGGAIPHIYYRDYSREKINIPSLSEQTAIAAILATADRELTLQKEKLAQLQQQKKGLMQVLLTGKKRLIN